jgi:hypothetical protein
VFQLTNMPVSPAYARRIWEFMVALAAAASVAALAGNAWSKVETTVAKTAEKRAIVKIAKLERTGEETPPG